LLDVAATFPQVRRIAWLRRLFPPLDAAEPGKDS
jgi:hypothetical protein